VNRVRDWLTDPLIDQRGDRIVHTACVVLISLFLLVGTYAGLAVAGKVPAAEWSPIGQVDNDDDEERPAPAPEAPSVREV
jgi:hypothetical protein